MFREIFSGILHSSLCTPLFSKVHSKNFFITAVQMYYCIKLMLFYLISKVYSFFKCVICNILLCFGHFCILLIKKRFVLNVH